MKFTHAFLDKHSRVLRAQDAPGIFRMLGEISHQTNGTCGIDEVRLIPFSSMIDPNMRDSKIALEPLFVGAVTRNNGKKSLLLGEGLCQALGSHYDATHITDELRAVIGHEMGHVHIGKLSYHMPGVFSLAFAVAAGMGAAHLLKRLYEKHAVADASEMTPQNREAIIDDLKQHKPVFDEPGSNMHLLSNAAVYIAGAVLGVGLTVAGMRQINHHMEFAADACSAKWMKDSKPMQNALKKLQGMFDNKRYSFYKDGRHAYVEIGLNQDMKTAAGRIETISEKPEPIEAFFTKIFGSLTHPTDQKRIDRLAAMSL